MPTYLRWVAALTAAVTAQFAIWMLVGALAVGTGNKVVDARAGAAAGFLGSLLAMIAGLAVNDWLARRYPREEVPGRFRASPSRPREEEMPVGEPLVELPGDERSREEAR